MVLSISLGLSATLAIIAGVMILIWPKSLNYAIAIWLLLNGILQLTSNY